MARRSGIVFIIVLLALSLFPAAAATDQGAAFALDCNGFTGTNGSIRLSRDNTGAGREAFIVSATDGAGNVIYQPAEDRFFVGGTVSWAGSPVVLWTNAPQFNPLVLRVVSRAGNGFGEDLIVMASGQCQDLPAYSAQPSSVFVIEGDLLILGSGQESVPVGATSPTVAINAAPPRPKNDEASLSGLPAVLVVNTDNLSLRSGDGVQYTLVGILDGGTRVIPLGRNVDSSWWYVQAGSAVGWASAEFLVLRGDASGTPVVPSHGELIQPSAFIHINQPLYAAPAAGSLPLCSIAGQQEYLVVGTNRSASWVQIQATCDGVLVNGWVEALLASLRNPANLEIPVTN